MAEKLDGGSYDEKRCNSDLNYLEGTPLEEELLKAEKSLLDLGRHPESFDEVFYFTRRVELIKARIGPERYAQIFPDRIRHVINEPYYCGDELHD